MTVDAVQKRVTKHVMFSAAHHIPGAGKCEQNHGHNWVASISIDQITGQLDKQGFVIDVRDVKNCAYKYDHDDLNKYFEYPSTENIAQQIADDALELCKENTPGATFIVSVHLAETPDNSADASASNFAAQFKPPEATLSDEVKKAHDAESAWAFGGGQVPPPSKVTKFVRREQGDKS